MRRPLACGQLCRPEVGVPWRPGSSARMAMSLPCGVIRGSSDAPPAGLRPAVPTGGRRSLAAGAICTNGGVFALRRHAGALMRGSSDAPPAGLRPAVPTGGRRSPAAGAICTNGAVSLRRHAGEQRCAARWPAASCADRRSAFPGGRCHPHGRSPACGGAAMRRPLACGQLCRAPSGELPRGRRSKPSPRFFGVVAYCRARKKQWQRTPFAACVTGGKV